MTIETSSVTNVDHVPIHILKELHQEPSHWKSKYTKFMLIWSVVAHTWLLIQIVKLYTSKDTNGLSLIAFCLLLISSIFWFIYGMWVIPQKSYPLILNASLSFTLNIIMITGIILYRK